MRGRSCQEPGLKRLCHNWEPALKNPEYVHPLFISVRSAGSFAFMSAQLSMQARNVVAYGYHHQLHGDSFEPAAEELAHAALFF